MPLSDYAIFNDYSYKSQTEVLDQQIEVFNKASRGTLILRAGANQGDFNETAHWAKISGGLVRRRNAYGSGAVAEKNLGQIETASVKIASGTPPVRVDPSWMSWIQRDPSEAGAVYGRQLAADSLADMLNTAITGAVTALSSVTTLVYNGTSATITSKSFSKGARRFGDRSKDIGIWLMHSSPLHDLYENNLDNTTNLFNYGTVNIVSDPFGRLFVVTDSPSLVVENGVAVDIDLYHTLGLVAGAITVEQNNDFRQNMEEKNGAENIIATIQSEWSYNLGLKGFSWDKANGGHSPTNAALATAANWERVAASDKDLLGVMINSR